MKKKDKTLSTILSVIAGAVFLISASSVRSQETLLTLLASDKDPQAGEIVYLQAWLDTAGKSINTVHLEIRYDTASLSLLESSFTGSVVPSIVERDTKTAGLVKLTGFRTTPFTGEGLVATLKFKALKTDSGKVTLLSTSTVHLADGSGTNIYTDQSAPVVNFPTDQFAVFDPATIPGLASEPDSSLLGQQTTPPEALFPEKEVEDYTGGTATDIQRKAREVQDEIGSIARGDLTNWLPVIIFGALALVGLVVSVILLIKKKKNDQQQY